MPRKTKLTAEDLQELDECLDNDDPVEGGAETNASPALQPNKAVRDLGPNPYVNLIHLARAFDAWRPFPRLFITVYIYLVYEVVRWAMHQEALTLEQSGLVSVVVSAGAAWFGLYTASGGNSGKE